MPPLLKAGAFVRKILEGEFNLLKTPSLILSKSWNNKTRRELLPPCKMPVTIS